MISQARYPLWILFATLSLSSFAQQGVTVRGSVTDAATKKPLPLVNVYFNNTTIGTSTDEAGRFVINNVVAGRSELTFSFIGYRTLRVPDLKLTPGADISIDVTLVPAIVTLAAITIHDKRRNDWTSKYKLFKKIFLGTTPNATRTEILNPEVLSFDEIDGDVGSENFSARASGPLEVENRALGYHASVTLDKFESIETLYNIVMNTRFDTLKAANRLEHQRWKKNRLDAYKGSQLHLFRSIAKGTYDQEGFKIYTVVRGQEAASSVPVQLYDLVVDSTRTDLKILRNGMYQVSYFDKVVPLAERKNPHEYFPVSIINVDDAYLGLYANGQVKLPANFWWSGYLYDHRFGDFVPSDYDPVTEEGELTLSARRELTSLSGTVVDENGNPLIGADVFINKGLNHTTTNAWGQFELKNLHPGKYSVGFADDGMQEVMEIVDVSGAGNNGIVAQLKERQYQELSEEKTISSEEREAYIAYFWRTMFRDLRKWEYSIDNPQALQFVRHRKSLEIWTTEPLIIDNSHLGYRWTYFISSASIIRRKLHVSGLIKMDTLGSRTRIQENRWSGNRMVEYEGSWNHLVSSLFDGRSSDEGFQFYQLHKAVGKRRPRFGKLKAADIVAIDPDSVLTPSRGRMFLHVIPGLEVHNENLKASHGFYRGLSAQVLRLRSDSAYVAISRTGIADPNELSIAGLPSPVLPMVPVDDCGCDGSVTDPDVLLYVQEENLKAVKNLLEKVYVQTDKPFYYPGDTLWFKAYLRYANLKYEDSLSHVLYADLLDPQGTVLSTAVIRIAAGISWGDIALASTLAPGDYYLRAYTSWMQNFDEFTIRSIPIISRDNFIAPGPVEAVADNGNDLLVSLSEDNPQHQTGESVALRLQVLKNGQPVEASFSVSVTDQSAIPDLRGLPNILSLNEPFKAENAEMIRISHPLERGITLHGKIDNVTEKSQHVVTVVLFNGDGNSVTPTTGPEFDLVVDFEDTTTAIIQSISKAGVVGKVEIEERQPVQSFNLPAPLSYQLVTGDSYVSQANKSSERVQVLKEIIVGAKRISNVQDKTPTMTQAKFGTAYKILEGEDLSFVRKVGNLADYLSVRVPQFYATWSLINSNNPGGPPGDSPGARTFQGMDQTFSTTSLAATSVPSFTNVAYSFTLNGQPILIQDFNSQYREPY